MAGERRFGFVLEDIVFDGNKTEFHSGEEVSGVIKFELEGSFTVTNIKILLVCISEVQWVESPHNEVQSNDNCFHEKMRLVIQSDSLPKKYESLSEGTHEVPFSFKLPENGIPSTFTDRYGSIKYFIEVIDEEPGVEEGHRVGLFEFGVNAPFRENLSISMSCSKEKEVGIAGVGAGKITLSANFSKKGWAPGQSLELHIQVDNQSTVDVTARATLYQTQIYMSGHRHRALEIPITDAIESTKVEKHSSVSETLSIATPDNLPLTIKSALIGVKYFVHVTLVPQTFDIQVNVPLVITNHPIPDIQVFT